MSGAEAERIRRDVARVLSDRPEARHLVEPQPGEPERLEVAVLRRGPSPLWIVQVDLPGVRGRAFAARLIGKHGPEAEGDLERLEARGIRWIFCLVPLADVADKHGASRYVAAARARFGERFQCVEIDDHDIPRTDDAFEAAVSRAVAALAGGDDVLVHCVGGCGRTGMFLSCAMVAVGVDPEEAIRAFRRARRCGPETSEQVGYVLRFAARRSRRSSVRAPRITLSRDEQGTARQLARGGLATVVAGRLHLASGRPRRVAVKLFAVPLTNREAEALSARVDALVAAGVRLPRMGVARLDDGRWVQVSPLFGGSTTGSKLHQPGTFYRELGPVERRFAVDQLARVANAGYRPSVDLFLAFRPPRTGIVPLDLDLIVPETDPAVLAGEIVKRILQISADSGDREALLGQVLGVAHEPIAIALRRLVTEEGPYQRLWKHF